MYDCAVLSNTLLESESAVAEGGAVRLAAEAAHLAGEAHHGGLHVEEGQLDGLGLVPVAVVRAGVRLCKHNCSLLFPKFVQIPPKEMP